MKNDTMENAGPPDISGENGVRRKIGKPNTISSTEHLGVQLSLHIEYSVAHSSNTAAVMKYRLILLIIVFLSFRSVVLRVPERIRKVLLIRVFRRVIVRVLVTLMVAEFLH